jgi:hypothetical protein
MAQIEERTLIAAPPDTVFDYRLDFGANLLTYNPSVREVVQTSCEGPGVGSSYRVRVRLAPAWTSAATLTVTEVLRPSRVADLAESFVSARETVTFEPRRLPDGRAGTEVRFVVQTCPKGLGGRLLDAAVLPWLTRRQVRTELRQMRQDLESQTRP